MRSTENVILKLTLGNLGVTLENKAVIPIFCINKLYFHMYDIKS